MGPAKSVLTTGQQPTRSLAPNPPDDGPLTIDRDTAREAAERELSKPEYEEHHPHLLSRVLDWVIERVDDLFTAAGRLSLGGWIGLLTVCLLVVLLVIALRLRWGPLRTVSEAGAQELFVSGPMSADQHRLAAEEFAADSRWNEALQERMRALVRALEERSVLQVQPGRTAGEVAAEAGRALPNRAAELQSAARSFDEVTYGHRTADAHAYNNLKELDNALANSHRHLTSGRRAGGAS